ncbi:hypothetical protein AB0J80_03755 [Actinoplanes sp. NPDC049548]|uniref:hypothetical protein n=1 Tax=Actinoplanes sp. NPDC049548 TaxID=3155152 RepID=UPI00342159FA
MGSNATVLDGFTDNRAGQLRAGAVKPDHHPVVAVLTDPALVRIGWLAAGISTVCVAVTALL